MTLPNPVLAYNPITDNLDLVYANNGGGGGGNSPGGGFQWQIVTSVSPANPITGAAGKGYICNGSDVVWMILPLSPALGDSFQVVANLQTFYVMQNANQTIRMGAEVTTMGVSGFLVSNFVGDRVIITYMGSNVFNCSAPEGTFSVN